MDETYSIARARDDLARLVHRAEKRRPVVLTRRGKPVAVLISYTQYERVYQGKGFAAAIADFRAKYAEDLPDLAEALEDLRDRDPGREVEL
jgi:prevent-host-death family protein